MYVIQFVYASLSKFSKIGILVAGAFLRRDFARKRKEKKITQEINFSSFWEFIEIRKEGKWADATEEWRKFVCPFLG